jgi:hypothetical protein
VLPPSSGLKCVGLGIGLFILADYKQGFHSYPQEGGKEMEPGPDSGSST